MGSLLKLKINTLIIVTSFLVFGCSHFKKNEAANTADTSEATNSLSSETDRVVQASTEEKRPKNGNTIIGASQFKKDEQSNIHKAYFLYGAEHLNLDNYYYDFPVVYNESVKKWLNYFQGRGRDYFERYSSRAGRYAPLMSKILDEFDMPKDLIFLAMAESGFQNKAKSWARAVGPWQFMPFTGKRYGLQIDWYIDERMDPIKSTIAAAKYLSKLYNDFGAWELAAAAYNAGEGKVGRAIRKYKTENFWHISKGRYLKSETKNYVPKIMALAILGKNLRSFGFEEIDFHEPLDFEEIAVGPLTDLYKVAEALKIDVEELQILNPEIMRWFTPPDREQYNLRVPVGAKVVYEDCCKSMDLKATAFKTYTVQGTRSKLADVARKFKIKPEILTHFNPTIDNSRQLARNTEVTLPFHESQHGKENMYADLYERPRKEVVRRKNYKSRINLAVKRGLRIKNPSRYYTVQRGDTLWDVARKNGISLDSLIASNIDLVRSRMIQAGDRLAVE